MADPNRLTGRALDEACAIALGHKIETLENGAKVMSRSVDSVATRVPRYSSAASTLDEKLAWLRQYGVVDIHDATARLVVAVASKEKKS